MRNNLKHFIIGALLAAAPVSLLVAKSMPDNKPKVVVVKPQVNQMPSEDFLWSSQLASEKRIEPKNSASNQIVSVSILSHQKPKATNPSVSPTPTAKPPVAPKPNVSPAPKVLAKIETPKASQTASYVVQIPSAPDEATAIIEKYAVQYGVNKDMMVGIAKCESGFRANAVNGPYAGIYQFVTSTWVSNRNAMGQDPNPNLRYNLEEAVKTAAFKMSRDGFGAWPVCQNKAIRLLVTQGI